MIILHAAPLSWTQIGGLNGSLLGMVDAQNRLAGVRAAMVTTHPRPAPSPQAEFPIYDRRSLLAGTGRLNLPAPFDRPDLVVLHSTYIPYHAVLAGKLRRLGIPYLLCPHGGMTRGAQRNKWLKKRLGNALFFRRLVAHARAIHCLSCGEERETVGWGRPIFVVGNGVALPPRCELAAPGSAERRRLVFLGRLDVWIKGLDWLLDGCRLAEQELRRHRANVELWGPDARGSLAWLKSRIGQHRLDDVVKLPGPALGETKAAMLRQADALLCISRSEGHPMAVLEALAQGLPCLLTPGTNVADEVTHAGAGWRVEPSAAGVAHGLRRILEATPSELQRAGANARALAEREYRWDRVAARQVENYRRFARLAMGQPRAA